MAGAMNILVILVLCGALLALRLYLGSYAPVTLLEYQRGIIYRKGLPIQDAGPGRHRVWSGIEKVMHLDTRPIQVSYENQQVGLRDGTAASYGFSATAQVRDARKAIYSSTNYTQIPAYVLLCSTRFVLNNSSGAQLKLNRDGVTNQIVERAKPRLAAAGFELLSFRIPQLAVRGDTTEIAELRD